MAYIITVSVGDGITRSIPNPSPEIIDDAIGNLIPVKFYYVILENSKPVNHCAFLQILMPTDMPDIKIYLVEARFNYPDDTYRMYKYFTSDSAELKRIFRMFALGVNPDITDWKDITASFMKRAYEARAEVKKWIESPYDEEDEPRTQRSPSYIEEQGKKRGERGREYEKQ